MGHFILENHPRTIVPRDREGGTEHLYQNYFSPKPVYPEHIFLRRFQMRRELFIHSVEELGKNSEYFQQRVDTAKILVLSPFQKCTAAIRILAYGSPADAVNEYIKIGESTALECLFKFCRAIIDVFGDVYMRKPTYNDVQ
ncbi:uncharacterized protein LOC110708845 [Chenopodium quinoa]|uniref:uncharacterized protein LOC110708845 n=1 Tax=Chenopodium quinoa TaxID=63459 RepID=UPI000B785749|nr:uncharacterized protein LOC110708845 [Chenopodium quinoa]